jgi:RNA polymerase sigma factor (sigma-70 family)
MTATTNRPATFDARVIAFLPAIRRTAEKCRTADPEDMAQDIVLRALETWTNYRDDGNFYGWLNNTARNIGARSKLYRERNVLCGDFEDIGVAPQVPGSQESATDLCLVLSSLPPRDRSIMSQVAKGHTLTEIGSAHGLSAERARQIIDACRARLRAAAVAADTRAAMARGAANDFTKRAA